MQIKLYTFYFALYGKDPNSVAITAYKPKFFKYRWCRQLAPTWKDIVEPYKNKLIDENEYKKRFISLIRKRNINFTRLAKQLGNNSVLLCYEKPDQFCHRHIIADLFKLEGIQCTERGNKDEKRQFHGLVRKGIGKTRESTKAYRQLERRR